MRKRFLSVLMIPLLLLAGCGEREAKLERRFAAFRDAVLGAASITFRAELTADFGGTAESYVLDAAYDGRETAVTVVEPRLLAGVTARARWGETTVEYGGVMLGMGELDADGLTPASALPVLLQAMAGGGMELLWEEDGLLAARLYAGENSRCTVWLDENDIPVAAEIASDGRAVVACTIKDWNLTPG